MRSNTAVGGVTDTVTASTAAVTSLVAAVHAGALHGEGHDELSALLARGARGAGPAGVRRAGHRP